MQERVPVSQKYDRVARSDPTLKCDLFRGLEEAQVRPAAGERTCMTDCRDSFVDRDVLCAVTLS